MKSAPHGISNEKILGEVRSNGFCILDPLTRHQVDEILSYLRGKPVFVGRHVVQGDTQFTTWTAAIGANVLCWRLGDVVCAPYLLERALSTFDLAAEYLGISNPILYSMNVFCTRPGHAIRPDIQGWHKDTDDTRFLPMFFYLTDVGPEEHQEVRVGNEIRAIEGKRGTVFFSDTMREHRGLKPLHNERIIGWARWGVSCPPPSYLWDKLAPIAKSTLGDRYPSNPTLQQAIRFLAE